MKKLICKIKTIWYTFQRILLQGEVDFVVDGHDWVEQKSRQLKCEKCNKYEEDLLTKQIND